MKTLYIECNREFSPEMLVGAIIDMGAPAGFIELQLKNCGIDAQIEHGTVKISGTEAVFAKCDVTDTENCPRVLPRQIEDYLLKTVLPENPSPQQIACVCAACFALIFCDADYIVANRTTGFGENDFFIKAVANEEGNPPADAPVIDVGYGAGKSDVLRAVLYGTEEQLSYEIADMLYEKYGLDI